MATSAEVPMDESTLVATSMEVQMKAIVATATIASPVSPIKSNNSNERTTTTTTSISK